MIKKYRLKIKFFREQGMTLFIAVAIMGILLLATFAVINIAIKSTLFASSGRDSHLAFYAADAGLECALYWDSVSATSKFDPNVSGSPISCGGSVITAGAAPFGTTTGTLIGGGGSGTNIDTVWVEDSLPTGATPVSDGDNWTWIGSNPAPYSGSLSHQSIDVSGTTPHQHYFVNVSLAVDTADTLFTYVYLNPASPPAEVMLQWNVGGSWEHRAYWGSNISTWGQDGTDSRRYMGPLPTTGQWVKLSVPASQVGAGGNVNGVAFSLWGGQVTWDYTGKSVAVANGTVNTTSTFGFVMNQGTNPTNACAIVTVTKNPDGTTYIKSRGYNTCDITSPRRIERGVEVTY